MTMGTIFITNWDFYNAVIDENEIDEFLKGVKRQTGAKRLHYRFRKFGATICNNRGKHK